MADRKPFKATPAPSPQKTAEESPAALPGPGIVEAQRTGQPLRTPSEEEVESRGHGHSPRIPWPPAGGPDDQHRPMKLNKS
jgi:hypothetical protein